MAKQRQSNSVRRIQIIEAAGRLIVKNGSENVTIRSIADEVGISEAAIYRHFDSKKDVWLMLANHIVDRLIEDIETSFSEDLTSLEVLHNSLNKHIAAIEKRRGISFQVIDEVISVGDRELNRKVYALLQKYMLRLQELVEAAMRDGWLDGNLNSAEAAQRRVRL